MTTPIEALAQEYSRNQRQNNIKSRCELTHHEQCVQDFKAGFDAGAKAASGQGEARIKELEEALQSVAMNFTREHINAVSCDNCGDKVWKALSGAGKGEG